MLRLIFRNIQRHSDPKKLENISNKPFFQHYKEAINLSFNNKLQESNIEFSKSLNEIQISKQKYLLHFSYILRRMAHNYRRLGQMKKAEEKLFEIIKHKRQSKVVSAILYEDYDILFKHLLTTDLQKAINLCKALLLKEKDDMPISHVKLFNLNLGIGYLTAGNYIDAKYRFSKCLEMDPQGKVKSYVLNNLGLACWWHKNPIERVREAIETNENFTVEKDFLQAKQIFAKAIKVSEQTGQDELNRAILQDSLDFKNGKLNEHLTLKQPTSFYPAYNLSRFFIANDPLQRFQILFWMKKALNLAKLAQNENQFEHIFSQFCLLSNKIDSLKQKLPLIIEKHRYAQQFVQQQYFCEVLGKVLIRQQNSQAQGQQLVKRARTLRSALPEWSWKLKFIAISPLNLIRD